MKITATHVALALGAIYLISKAKKSGGMGQSWEGADPWGQNVKVPYGDVFTDAKGALVARYADPSKLLRSSFTTGKVPLPSYYSSPNLDPWGIKADDALAISESWRRAQWQTPEWYGQGPEAYGGWGSYAPQEQAGYLYGMGR